MISANQITVLIDTNKVDQLGDIVWNLKNQHLQEFKQMEVGENYYLGKQGSDVVINHYKAIVDQKVAYTNVTNFTLEPNSKVIEEKGKPIPQNETLDYCNKFYTKDERLKLNNLVTRLVNYGNVYRFYSVELDSNNKPYLKAKTIKRNKGIPIYRDSDETKIDAFITWDTAYSATENDNIEMVMIYLEDYYVVIKRTYVKNVVSYSWIDNSYRDVTDPRNYHYQVNKTYTDGTKTTELIKAFDGCPVVEFKYNDYKQPLIDQVKSLQDKINKNYSEYDKNLDAISEVYMAIKGFEDAASTIDDKDKTQEIKNRIKNDKAILLPADDEDGSGAGIKIETADIPYKGRLEYINKNEEKIYEVGKGVSSTQMILSGFESGVSIEKLFKPLEMDCTAIKDNFEVGLTREIEVITTFAKNMGILLFPEEIIANISLNPVINVTEAITNIERLPISQKSKMLMYQKVGVIDNAENELILLEEEDNADVFAGADGVPA